MSSKKDKTIATQELFTKKFENIEPFSVLESDNMSAEQKTLDNQFSIITMSSKEFFDAKKVSDFIKSKNITENVFFMGAFSFVLSRFLGAKECGFVIDVNKNKETINDAKTKVLPLYVNVTDDKKVEDYLNDIKEDYSQTLIHSNISFEELEKNYGVSDDILFDYVKGSIENDVESIINKNYSDITSKFIVAVFKDNSEYSFVFKFLTNFYSNEYIKSFAESILTVSNELMIKQSISEIDMLSIGQKKYFGFI